ncbi:Uncharacterised protein [Mycobacterium tuberculosis]|nr:Uncharacterised protein [Mycobacterium tuberculosis]
MVNFSVLPPEINSGRMFFWCGVGADVGGGGGLGWVGG